MKSIMDDYIENGFDAVAASDWKKLAFSYNYRRFFPEDMNAAILDIGVGRGEMLLCMREWGYRNRCGVDISESAVRCCREQGEACELVDDTMVFLRARTKKFTLITLLDVVEHISREALPEFMAAVHDALIPGGRVIIQTPNMQAPFAGALRHHDLTHQLGLDERSMGQLLKIVGFRSFDFYGYEEYFGNGPNRILRRILRKCYQFSVLVARNVNGFQEKAILHPVFFAVAARQPDEAERC